MSLITGDGSQSRKSVRHESASFFGLVIDTNHRQCDYDFNDG